MNTHQSKYYLLSVLLFMGCQSSSYNWYSGNFEEAKTVVGSKLILLDFYTDT